MVENTTGTMYHSLALEFRRRASRGLQYSGSYVFGHGDESMFLSKRIDPIRVRNGGTVGDLTHAFKMAAVYSLPFGRGERWGSNVNGFVDRVIGGWQVAGSARVQSGRLLDLGNVRLVGMDQDYLQSVFKLRTNAAGQVFMFPQEIIDESFKAFSVSAHVGQRLRQPRRPERPLHRPGRQPRLHRADSRRRPVRSAVGGAHRSDVQAVRPRTRRSGSPSPAASTPNSGSTR